MPTSERTKVDRELRKLGFGGLDDPNLNSQIAFCIRDHEHFKRQLFSVAPEKRRLAYAQLRPHLRFPAKPLDVYEAEMKEMADRQQLPTLRDGEVYPTAYKVADININRLAEEAIAQTLHEKDKGLTLTCAKCTKQEVFRATLRITAERESREAGWRSDGLKSWCPEHAPTRCTMKMECQKCGKKEQIRCWDATDGYRAARLSGWVIEDGAECPRCSVKLIAFQ
jgi:hypothetical protein